MSGYPFLIDLSRCRFRNDTSLINLFSDHFMTDRGSSPEPDYPWTRWHRSEEQTTRDPDHWNASNRSRSESEDRDPNDDPYTYHRASPEPVQIRVTRRTYIDVDANRLTENDIPLPTRPRTLTEDLRVIEQPPLYNQFLHGRRPGSHTNIHRRQNCLISREDRLGHNLIEAYLYRQQRVAERQIAGYPVESEPLSQHHATEPDSVHQAQVNNFRLNLRADRYARLHLIDQFRQAIGFLSFSAFLAALLSIFYNVI